MLIDTKTVWVLSMPAYFPAPGMVSLRANGTTKFLSLYRDQLTLVDGLQVGLQTISQRDMFSKDRVSATLILENPSAEILAPEVAAFCFGDDICSDCPDYIACNSLGHVLSITWAAGYPISNTSAIDEAIFWGASNVDLSLAESFSTEECIDMPHCTEQICKLPPDTYLCDDGPRSQPTDRVYQSSKNNAKHP
jgi:hypothetical protein